MKKTLRKKFIFFAMSAVTILLVVLIGAINLFSWVILDKQSDDVLHMLAEGDEKFFQMKFRDRGPFQPPMNMDTIKSARFFMVRMDMNGVVQDVNVDQIFSITEEMAEQYAKKITGDVGKIDTFKYESKQLGMNRLIFFMDISGQIQTFVMVLSISCVIALFCWIAIFLVVFFLSGRVIRPILAGMEKQKQFITNAGHELKTPLAIILSNNDASTLLYGETKYSRNIRQQIRRLNELMTNLLTLAKLDEEMTLPTEMVNLSEWIGGMLSAYESVMVQKNIAFVVKMEPEVMMQIHTDTFSQMISILLDNATKYTPNGGTIWFTVKKEGKHIEIIEENTCDTFPASEPERLFERFYRGDSARTQENDGAGYGIGLSAARAIAETFQGTLKAYYTEKNTIRFVANF